MTAILIATALISGGLGLFIGAMLAAGCRADLTGHIIALRDVLHKAHQIILQHHRANGGQMELLQKIETTVEATFDDQIF